MCFDETAMDATVIASLVGFASAVVTALVASGVSISKTKAQKFRSKATRLRIALRAEIGVEDLAAAREIATEG